MSSVSYHIDSPRKKHEKTQSRNMGSVGTFSSSLGTCLNLKAFARNWGSRLFSHFIFFFREHFLDLSPRLLRFLMDNCLFENITTDQGHCLTYLGNSNEINTIFYIQIAHLHDFCGLSI